MIIGVNILFKKLGLYIFEILFFINHSFLYCVFSYQESPAPFFCMTTCSHGSPHTCLLVGSFLYISNRWDLFNNPSITFVRERGVFLAYPRRSRDFIFFGTGCIWGERFKTSNRIIYAESIRGDDIFSRVGANIILLFPFICSRTFQGPSFYMFRGSNSFIGCTGYTSYGGGL